MPITLNIVITKHFNFNLNILFRNRDVNSTSIKNNIRELRFFADEMTQQELAELVGVTRQTIIAIEKSKHSPTLEVAFKIAIVFGHSLEEVFQYQVEN